MRPVLAEAVVTRPIALRAVSEVLELRDGLWGPIDGRTPFADIALDSLELAELFMVLEEETGTRFDPESAIDFAVIDDLVRLVPLRSDA